MGQKKDRKAACGCRAAGTYPVEQGTNGRLDVRSFGSIQEAIDAAPPGETVVVPPGFYHEQLVIGKPLTLTGPDPGQGEAVIDAAGMAVLPTIWILSSDVTVRRLTLQNGPGPGIRAGSASFPGLSGVLIEHNVIRGHGRAGVLTVDNAAVRVQDNLIEDNGQVPSFERAGVLLYPHGPSEVLRNTIRSNYGDGVFARASGSGLLIEGNTITGHNFSGITLAWDERNVVIRNNRLLNNGLGVNDQQGGIVILQSSAEIIQGNEIVSGKRYGIIWAWVPTVGPVPAEIRIEGNTIVDSSLDAIYLFTQGPGGWIPPDLYPLRPIVAGNDLRGNGRAGVYVSNLYYFSPGNANPTLTANSLQGNAWGVFNATAATVNAENNWWGAPSGPFHPTLNPQGTGDPVSDRVDFIPWLLLPPPRAVECLEVRRVLAYCLVEDTISGTFLLSPAPPAIGGTPLAETLSAIGCRVVEASCCIENVGPPLIAPAPSNQRPVTLRYQVQLAVSVSGDQGETVGTFTPTITKTSTIVMDFSSVADLNDPVLAPALSCSVARASASCTLLAGSPPAAEYDVNLCALVQLTVRALLRVPVYGFCQPPACSTPSL